MWVILYVDEENDVFCRYFKSTASLTDAITSVLTHDCLTLYHPNQRMQKKHKQQSIQYLIDGSFA
jgi:hypothetical protein